MTQIDAAAASVSNNNNTDFQKQFLRRINIDENKKIEFYDLPQVMRMFASNIPFENSDVIGLEPSGITKDYLIEKVLVKSQGGLCYHLNTLMYFFLTDCGFQVKQMIGTVWNQITKDRWAAPFGHCITLLTHNNSEYLIDVGFGLFLALAPIPFQSIISSRTGEYRWLAKPTEYGTHSLELRPNPDEDFHLAYTFTLDQVGVESINKAQEIIHIDELKTFNAIPLTAILLEPSQGQATMTGDTLTITKPNGEKVKESITPEKRQELLSTMFKFK
ncbi:arylamine N-acetyltransferase family protein [Heterostelium album PN500]|uniref:Arylamine N-acetyltransferase family protein n=2 Tax=Heterostelium TaxID=2058189 RepID=D3BMJ6_HETP5|nr:arylamine N-acetyltransferase family protein [Heterostelium album PN500]EFA77208.1 arylamine N-acetyltransferase family protein [Heterostelium album PN500]CBL43366.1 TPA: arylamine N-acetyltransferase 1 [Heterostelium pallidum]|eukprot:XP_020429337.1 arylamine N-acetyltransferase family protein [Heterostelium album PN500]